MKPLKLPGAALKPEVLKFVAPAYALPLVVHGVGLATGLEPLALVWQWLFAPAVGLHALLALNVASRESEDGPKGRRQLPAPEAPPDQARVQREIEAGFEDLKHEEGLKAARDLAYEYAQLQPVLERRRATDSLSIGQLPALANETYRQGLSVLQDALDLNRAVTVTDRKRQEDEIDDLETRVAAAKRADAEPERLRILQERLASSRDDLEFMKKQQLRVDELLYQA